MSQSTRLNIDTVARNNPLGSITVTPRELEVGVSELKNKEGSIVACLKETGGLKLKHLHSSSLSLFTPTRGL